MLLPGRAGVAGVRARAVPRQRVAAKILQQRAAASHVLPTVQPFLKAWHPKWRYVCALEL